MKKNFKHTHSMVMESSYLTESTDILCYKSDDDVIYLREQIRQKVLDKFGTSNGKFRFNTEMLKYAYKLYCRYFLGHLIDTHYKIDFKVSNRMTRAAGKVSESKTKLITVTLAKKPFINAFHEQSCNIVNGVECHSILHAILVTLEHELIHICDLVIFEGWEHGKSFKNLMYYLFRHTEIRHRLGMDSSIPYISPVEAKEKFKVHDVVFFMHRGEKITGEILRRGRRFKLKCYTEGEGEGEYRIFRVAPHYLQLENRI